AQLKLSSPQPLYINDSTISKHHILFLKRQNITKTSPPTTAMSQPPSNHPPTDDQTLHNLTRLTSFHFKKEAELRRLAAATHNHEHCARYEKEAADHHETYSDILSEIKVYKLYLLEGEVCAEKGFDEKKMAESEAVRQRLKKSRLEMFKHPIERVRDLRPWQGFRKDFDEMAGLQENFEWARKGREDVETYVRNQMELHKAEMLEEEEGRGEGGDGVREDLEWARKGRKDMEAYVWKQIRLHKARMLEEGG
ncbi:uncharacterized protein BDZ99DRAFT_545600, partial [Mytilinidion resinicola]